ncbi:MAG: MFS transporter [Ignavibacteria bacterium]|nr:MFS transporter [Ignavibacteria bacterium]
MQPGAKKNIILYFLTDINVFISVYLSFFSLSWITFKLTGSPAALGKIGFAQNLPFLLFSIYGGVLADKYDRRKNVIKCNVGLTLVTIVSIILVVTDLLSFPLILMLGFSLGSVFALNYPSMIGLVKDLVTDKQVFPRVMGAAASNAKIGQVAASSTFSFIFAAFQAVGTFAGALLANLIALTAIILVKKPPQEINLQSDSVKTQFVTGIKYVFQYKPLLAVVLISTMISVVFGFVTFQLPIIDSDFLKGGSKDLGILYLAGAIGGLASGIYMSRRKSTKNILRFLIICAFISGISITGIAISRSMITTFIFAMGVDFAFIAAMGINNTVLQMLTEESKRGRVLGVNTSFNWGVMSIVIMIFGYLAKYIGMEVTIIIVGVLTIASGFIFALTMKKYLPVLKQMYAVRGVEPGHEPF